jgi:DNA primase
MFDLDKLLDAVDLPRLAESYGTTLTPHRGGEELRGKCPLHGGDNPTAFVVTRDNHARWRWHCYTGCTPDHGDALDFFMQAENLTDFKDAVQTLAARIGFPLADLGFTPEHAAELTARKLRTEVRDLAAQLWSQAGAEALAYARGRGFTDDTLRLAGWGFSDGGPGLRKALEHVGADMALAHQLGLIRADGDDFTANQEGGPASPSGWLIYPHRPWPGTRRKTCSVCEAETWHAPNGEKGLVCLRHHAVLPSLTGITYFSSRALAPINPKDKARNLPGARHLYRAEVPGDRNVILVEGPADAESLRQLGFSTWALCGLGHLPEEDRRALRQRPGIYLALDGDEAGQKKQATLAQTLGPLTLLVPPFAEGKDANAFLQAGGTAATMQATLKAGTVWLEQLLEQVTQVPPHERPALTTQIARLLEDLPKALAPRYTQLASKKLGLSRRELQALVHPPEQKNGNPTLASVRDGQLCFLGEPLGNFAARITHELARDNGQDLPEVQYLVIGQLVDGTPLPPVVVDAEKFDALNWIPRHWGARVILYVPKGKAYLVARAIQEVSLPELVQERVFTHTGLRLLQGVRGYLSASGFLTAEGLDATTRVDLGTNNRRHYCLPAPPEGEALKTAVRASLDFLKLGPLHVTAPLWAAMYAAPLTEIRALYTVLWVYGATQSGKSTVAHLALTHFGTGFISGRQYHAPENWQSTSNTHEFAMFMTKDAPLVIDDFAPQFSSAGDSRDMGKKAQKLVRAVGNREARGRMQANMHTQQTSLLPRGLVLVTAELPLPGESTTGRMLYVPIDRGEVLPHPGERTRPALDQAQADAEAGQYAFAMSAYLRWLLANWDRVTPRFLELLDDSLKVARQAHSDLPNRLPDYYALLDAAQQTALTAFYEMGILTLPEALEILQANGKALLEVVSKQSARIAAESPVRKFFEALDNLLERQKVYLAPRAAEIKFSPPFGADLIGYYDPEPEAPVYLNDATCLQHVRAYWSDLGENFDTTQDALRRQFVQVSGLLEKVANDGKVAVLTRTREGQKRLLHFSLAKIYSLYGISLRNLPHAGEEDAED